MNVLLRNTQSEKGARRRRYSAIAVIGSGKPMAHGEQHAPAPLIPPAPVARRVDDGSPGRRHLHGPTQDTATYYCHCGYVFEAAVSTSVGCPHCGDGQAW
jgi:hypothetical protein